MKEVPLNTIDTKVRDWIERDSVEGKWKKHNSRWDKFNDFTHDLSYYLPYGSLDLYIGEDSDLTLYERGLAEFTATELTDRKSYHDICEHIAHVAIEQIEADRMSCGVRKLLEVAISYCTIRGNRLPGRPTEELYDVMLAGPEGFVKTRGVYLAQEYREALEEGRVVEHAREYAVRAVVDFLRAAEIERFEGTGDIPLEKEYDNNHLPLSNAVMVKA